MFGGCSTLRTILTDLKNRLQRRGLTVPYPRWIRALALVFALVVGGVSTVEAAHIHGEWLPQSAATVKGPALASQGQGEEKCPLCVAMHSALPANTTVVPEPVEQVAQAFTARVVDAPQRLRSFAMFSRPPPAMVLTPSAG